MKLDDEGWHSGTLEADQPYEYAGAHIALFIHWLAVRSYLDDSTVFDPNSIEALKNNKMQAYTFLEKECDGKIIDYMAIPEIQGFLKAYYSGKPIKGWTTYFTDLVIIIGEECVYNIAESNIDKRTAYRILDQRLEEWKNTYSKVPKGLLSKLFSK